MRWFFALLFSLVVGTVALAAPTNKGGRNWTATVRAAPAGGYVVGNPAAKVKLVEYVSYTCPHCKHFGDESRATLDGMVRSGSTSVEVRNQIHDKIDFVAVILARCVGAARFRRYHEAVYATQDQWFGKAAAFEQSGAAAKLPTNQARAKAFADASGLSAIALKAGLSQRELDRCFADTATIDAVAKSAAAIPEAVDSTPAFEINGALITRVGWSDLEPKLRAAGAK